MAQECGITRPYFHERIAVGIPPSMREPSSLSGLAVAVRTGDPSAAALIAKHASPRRVPELAAEGFAIAAPEWRIAQLRYRSTRFDVANGWLMRLEEFLFQRQS